MSLEKVEHCPLCNGKSFHPFLVCKDHTTTGELFHVEQCADCEMLITNPRPTEANAGGYYQSSQYISHTGTNQSLMDSIYLIFRRLTLKWKYRLAKPYLLQNRLLDFGCGTGNFPAYCHSRGIEAYGVEPSPEARALSQEENIKVVDSVEKLPDLKFDVITLWHVLEHVYDLPSTIDQLKKRMTDNGIIFIAVPNWQSEDAGQYKEMWAGYDVPRHVWHFSKTNMTMLAQKAGLKLTRIIPMKLDAYYVSLLSERNKGEGKLSLGSSLRAIALGLKSNGMARRKMNYSSLIYLLKK